MDNVQFRLDVESIETRLSTIPLVGETVDFGGGLVRIVTKRWLQVAGPQNWWILETRSA